MAHVDVDDFLVFDDDLGYSASRVIDINEGMPGTWSHCGSKKVHDAHRHRVIFQEGPYENILCKGYPGNTSAYAQVRTINMTEDVQEPEETKFVVVGDYLFEDVGGCTCGTYSDLYVHERCCGIEPIVAMDKIQGLDDYIKERIKNGM